MSEMIKVPDGWEVIEVGKLIKVTTGNKDTVNADSDGIYPFVIRSQDLLKINTYLFDGEAVLIAGDGDIRNIFHYFNGKFDFHQRVYCLHSFKKNLNGKYFYYFFRHNFVNQVNKYSAKGTVDSVRLEMITKMPMNVPPVKEQEKIAKILSTLDKSIEATNSLIEKEKNIKKALMQELLTNGIDKDGHIRTRATHTYKESELGLIPEEWEIVSLDKCSTITNSNVDKKSSVEEQEIKLCNYMDVYVNDEIDNSIDFMVATATELEIKKFTLKKDDVIITKDSESPDDIGIPSYVAEDLKDVICGYHLTMIRPKKNCYGKYLALLLQGNYYKKYFGKLASGSTRFALSLGTISHALITLPSITEQKQIAKILTTQDKKIETEETNLVKLKELKKGIMNDLLSGKVRVKV